jgi:Xaa-Pro aminopeptidase
MNSSEINKVKKACKITDKILNQLIKKLKKHSFKTELDTYNYLKSKVKENNCKLAYKPIVAIGKNAAEIHHKPTKTKLTKGFLVIDFGVKYKGYCADETRTFYLGNPSKKEKQLYNLVLEAQLTAISYLKPGIYAADIDGIARAILQGHFKHFIHSTGHGVGKKVHTSPTLRPRSRLILKENQIITIEPGLYFKNKSGIRIEDTILIKNNPIILTKTTKKLIII